MNYQSEERNFSAHPLALVAAAFAAGVLITISVYGRLWLTVIVAAGATVCSLLALLTGRHRLATMSLMIATGFLGGSLANLERERIPPNQLKRLIDTGQITIGSPVEITGVLIREPEPAPDRIYLHLQAESALARGLERKTAGVVILLVPSNGTNSAALEASTQRRPSIGRSTGTTTVTST